MSLQWGPIKHSKRIIHTLASTLQVNCPFSSRLSDVRVQIQVLSLDGFIQNSPSPPCLLLFLKATLNAKNAITWFPSRKSWLTNHCVQMTPVERASSISILDLERVLWEPKENKRIKRIPTIYSNSCDDSILYSVGRYTKRLYKQSCSSINYIYCF